MAACFNLPSSSCMAVNLASALLFTLPSHIGCSTCAAPTSLPCSSSPTRRMCARFLGARSWPKPSAMTAAYNHQEMDVLDAAAQRPPPSSSTVAGAASWHTSSAFSCPPHRVAGSLVRAARCCPRQQTVPHSALSTGFTFKFTARIFGGSCARLSRLSRLRRVNAEPRPGTASSSACPTSQACAYTMFRMAGDALILLPFTLL